jgi:16S rRNA (guanine527-N7)-methyltransferase
VWPTTTWVLLDGSRNRAEFLEEAVGVLGLADRVEVVGARAELAGRGPLRGGFEVVVARSFASPAATAECGAPFLQPGGRLIVTEPPGGQPGRWDAKGLAVLGLHRSDAIAGPTSYQILVQQEPCPDRYPRRVGIPVKRPLF